MGISLRGCLACILPCGALDLIRILHSNGYVEELTGRVTAGAFLQNYPDHVLSKPTAAGVSRRILIVSPDSQLKRGSIYFLVPSSSLPAAHHDKTKQRLRHNPSKQRRNIVPEKKLRRRKVTAGDWRPDLDCISEEF